MQTKTCTACHETKTIDQFGKQKGGKYGVKSECKPCDYARWREWEIANPEKRKATRARAWLRYSRKVRSAALQALGGSCVRCGFSDARALDIDHVDGDGRDHRESKNSVAIWLSIVNGTCTQEVQLLCANCHRIKGIETGTGPGRRYE